MTMLNAYKLRSFAHARLIGVICSILGLGWWLLSSLSEGPWLVIRNDSDKPLRAVTISVNSVRDQSIEPFTVQPHERKTVMPGCCGEKALSIRFEDWKGETHESDIKAVFYSPFMGSSAEATVDSSCDVSTKTYRRWPYSMVRSF